MLTLLPVITARRVDRRDRGYLARIAIAGEIVRVPLETAPMDKSTHVLEVYVDGFDEPLVLLAEPVGAPDESGFPLRLSPCDERHAEALRRELFGAANAASEPQPRSWRPRRLTSLAPPRATDAVSTLPPPVSANHALALDRADGESMTSSRRAPGSLVGRSLADGRFVLEQLIGGGATGEVYRGIHTQLRRPCAVKVLHPTLQHSQDFCARFYAEALAASRLDHRNIVRIIDYGQEADGILYIVMELLEGRNLQQIVDAEGPLPLRRLINLASQVCAGLAHAHDAGVVHRDIKPENVVVVSRTDDEGERAELVKLCDFGVAHWVPEVRDTIGDDEATQVQPPESIHVVGTPAYMAPEQIRNEPVDARTDVYALGVLLYELATGQPPFVSARPMEVLLMHVTLLPRRPSEHVPEVHAGLERIILDALAKDPAKRHPDVRTLRAALHALVDDDWSEGSARYLRRSGSVTEATHFETNTAEALAALTLLAPHARGIALERLSAALHAAVHVGDVRLAGEIVSWLGNRLIEDGLSVEERDGLERAIRVLRDPTALRALAEKLLSGTVERPDLAFPALALSGAVAAGALVEARRALPQKSAAMRTRFVSFMRAAGPGALPVILTGLQLVGGLATSDDEALAEDLLWAAPHILSDFGGDVAVRFARLDKPGLAAAALYATVAFWGQRARGLVLGGLDTTHDTIRMAAVNALPRLGPLDDWTLERLGQLLVSPGPVALRVGAATALVLAPAASHGRVVAFIRAQLLPPPRSFVASLIEKAFGRKDDAAVVIALAKSLFVLDPAGSRSVLDRLATLRPELRADVDGVLTECVRHR